MKRQFTITLKLILLTIFIVTAGIATAQERDPDAADIREINTEHDRIIKINPLQIGAIYFSFEKLRTERVANEYGIGYVYKSYLKNGTDDWKDFEDREVMGIAIHMSQRYYNSTKREAPFGFFHGPVFGYRFLVFEKNAFNLPEQDPASPNFRYVGRLYQNSLDVSYQLGWQFLLGKGFTTEFAGSLGARVKYAKATSADELLPQYVIGHELISDESSYIALAPLPQFKFSLGYSF
jgi:hypothetical protein